MSLAKVNSVKSARKDPGTCRSCGVELRKGDPYLWFIKGFRSRFKEVFCTKPTCYPKPSQRESSMLADVYAAQESFDVSTAESFDEVQNDLEDLAASIREVADQYREAGTNDMGVEWNMDAIERADILDAAADDLESWSPDCGDEPGEDQDQDEWLETLRDEAQTLVDGIETP